MGQFSAQRMGNILPQELGIGESNGANQPQNQQQLRDLLKNELLASINAVFAKSE
jgi:hypothetical protein